MVDRVILVEAGGAMANSVSEDDIRRIYNATIDGLYHYVSSRCAGQRELTEDITQETWLRAVSAWQSKGLPDQPAAWLTTVARNLLATHYRGRLILPLDLAEAEFLTAPVTADPEARSTLITRALGRLPAPVARLLSAFHLHDRRVADIAAEQGLTERAVEGRLRR